MEPELEIELVDESGTERRFRVHDAAEGEGTTYYLVEALDGGGEVMILKERSGRLETVEEDELELAIALLESEP
ncbi:MAG TPA: hypothetical protein VFD49_18180 [Candidatus Dormibacteraeota bacterium]|nr:hypothetical protein [Candidatus Dormibacteraeota bacterium]